MERHNGNVKGKTLIDSSNKTALLIAFHYPPCQSAGTHRTEKFAYYLTQMGWNVVVLTVHERVYAQKESARDVQSKGIHVHRCFAFDSARTLAYKGKYLGFTCVPDRWWSWAPSAIAAGKKLIEEFKPDVIWSTYPIITAHFVAYRLHKGSGIPWVADYRDPLQSRYDSNVQKYSWASKYIEKLSIKNSTKAVFTTTNARDLYRNLYPEENPNKFIVIENGFDEDKFDGVTPVVRVDNQIFQLLHSGDVYGVGRDPSDVFKAIANLKRRNILHSSNFRLVFRGVTDRTKLDKAILSEGLEDIVELLPMIGYQASLSEMLSSDGLLLLQGPLFNNQVPSKLYDYIRAAKPILANTPLDSATASVLTTVPTAICAPNQSSIEQAIIEWMMNRSVREVAGGFDYNKYSRLSKTVELASVFNDILDFD